MLCVGVYAVRGMLCSVPVSVCSLLSALCSLLSAVCSLLSAVCSLLSAVCCRMYEFALARSLTVSLCCLLSDSRTRTEGSDGSEGSEGSEGGAVGASVGEREGLLESAGSERLRTSCRFSGG
jgi:hypothetical protein